MNNPQALPSTAGGRDIAPPQSAAASRLNGTRVQGYCRMCHHSFSSEGEYVGACAECRTHVKITIRVACPEGHGSVDAALKVPGRLNLSCGCVLVAMSGLGFALERYVNE